MYNHWLFFSYWLTNILVLLLGRWLFSADLVLGNWRFTPVEAAFYSGFWITFVVWIFWDFLLARALKFNSVTNFFWFFLANVIGVWMTAHINYYTGLGISSWVMAPVAGLLANLGQRLVRRWLFNGR